jgi:hypothetical protein
MVDALVGPNGCFNQNLAVAGVDVFGQGLEPLGVGPSGDAMPRPVNEADKDKDKDKDTGKDKDKDAEAKKKEKERKRQEAAARKKAAEAAGEQGQHESDLRSNLDSMIKLLELLVQQTANMETLHADLRRFSKDNHADEDTIKAMMQLAQKEVLKLREYQTTAAAMLQSQRPKKKRKADKGEPAE